MEKEVDGGFIGKRSSPKTKRGRAASLKTRGRKGPTQCESTRCKGKTGKTDLFRGHSKER